LGRAWWFRVLQAVVLAGAAVYLFRVAAPQWPAIRARSLVWQPLPLALSALLIVANLAWMIALWNMTLRWCAVRLRYWDAARIWFTANLARFLPGAVLQFASLALMATRYGVSPTAATATVLLQQIVLLLTGLIVVAGFTPVVLHQGWWQGAFVVALLLGAGILLLLPRLTRRLPSLARLWSQVRPTQLPGFALLLAIQWLAYGAAFRLLAIGLLGGGGGDAGVARGSWGFYITAFTESYLAGVIAVFAPAGLLVREAALISVLTPVLGGADAVILAVAARIWHTALELLSGLAVLTIPMPPAPAHPATAGRTST
jgi:glycosyltransferase 2 family protein